MNPTLQLCLIHNNPMSTLLITPHALHSLHRLLLHPHRHLQHQHQHLTQTTPSHRISHRQTIKHIPTSRPIIDSQPRRFYCDRQDSGGHVQRTSNNRAIPDNTPSKVNVYLQPVIVELVVARNTEPPSYIHQTSRRSRTRYGGNVYAYAFRRNMIPRPDGNIGVEIRW
ncbi:hypothetical protein BDQ17DRAFT_824247 [Cyathus striatus]|nr:hypothetical protein BDQ17DRAFT_824247 [Cyathus striatus]